MSSAKVKLNKMKIEKKIILIFCLSLLFTSCMSSSPPQTIPDKDIENLIKILKNLNKNETLKDKGNKKENLVKIKTKKNMSTNNSFYGKEILLLKKKISNLEKEIKTLKKNQIVILKEIIFLKLKLKENKISQKNLYRNLPYQKLNKINKQKNNYQNQILDLSKNANENLNYQENNLTNQDDILILEP